MGPARFSMDTSDDRRGLQMQQHVEEDATRGHHNVKSESRHFLGARILTQVQLLGHESPIQLVGLARLWVGRGAESSAREQERGGGNRSVPVLQSEASTFTALGQFEFQM